MDVYFSETLKKKTHLALTTRETKYYGDVLEALKIIGTTSLFLFSLAKFRDSDDAANNYNEDEKVSFKASRHHYEKFSFGVV